MNNTVPLSYQDLVSCFGQAATHLPHNISATGVSTDSRTLQAGNIFVALRGETFDAHHHIQSAFDKGAVACIVEQEALGSEQLSLLSNTDSANRLITVANTLHALGTLAWYHRRGFDIPILAVAGSAGKTSTKDLVAHVLGQEFSVLKTQANYNNKVGTPLTLLMLDSSVSAAVIEIGTNEPGEIEYLTAMVQPTHGIITQIGKEHLEKLIDLDGVEREETALFDYLKDHGGSIIVNANDERLIAWYRRNGVRGLLFGVDVDADIRVDVSFDSHLHPIIHVVAADGGMRATLQTVGYAAALNGVAAFACAKAMGMHVADIKRGLESYAPPPSHGYARMVIEEIADVAVLNDTYNANPESMRMALRTLRAYNTQQRIAILGDMRELGSSAPEEHSSILSEALESADVVIVMGSDFTRAAIQFPGVHVCDSPEACAVCLCSQKKAGAAVLVKGSRSLRMEDVISTLRDTQCCTT